MPVALQNMLTSLGARIKSFSIAQRTLAILAIAILVLGGIFVASQLTKPQYTPLFTGLAATDASAVVTQLQTDGVQYQLADGGATILVPQSAVYSERLKVAAAGLPADNTQGYALLDQMGVTSSEFQQNVTYKRAIEGELAKTIEAMDGVKTASVQLAIPQQTVFTDDAKDPTASVFVATMPGITLSTEQVQAIVHLTSASIEGMKATDVSVVDAQGDVLSTVGGGAAGTSSQQQSQYQTQVQTSVQNMLDKVLGAGNSTVVVAADMSQNSGTKVTQSYSNPTGGASPISESSSTESYGGSGAGSASGATGVLGPDNIAVPSGSSTTGTGSGYVNSSSTKDNAVDKTTESTTIPSGTLTKQTVSVAINSKIAKNLNLGNINDLVAKAAGIDPTRGDSLSVQMVDFNGAGAAQAKQALAASAAQAASDGRMQLIKTGLIAAAIGVPLILGLFLLTRRGRRQEREDIDLGELQATGPSGTAGTWPGAATVPLSLDDVEARRLLESGGSPQTAPTMQLPSLGEEGRTMERKRAEIDALAGSDPDRTAELLRGLLDDRQSV
ncbi:flagellar M-ring protein FliF [Frondihabitans sp. PAMC 28766]|uniref:flagellar basal-body MS-ring/collar protein FliF n=1 Tax=Frondihabitans sp. PAMC 28766 TaxID=1795630 RepID=UPI00078CAD66|nr:flagellar basal-body MS-ring/collar protein FliF [Frondihabitans sp. PAMC 28766]AMM19704.1 flagellar M-ring protein FliF [Frondihabitans sp. PAMC 28766]